MISFLKTEFVFSVGLFLNTYGSLDTRKTTPFEMHFPKIFNQWVSGIHVKIEILSDLYTIFNEKYSK